MTEPSFRREYLKRFFRMLDTPNTPPKIMEDWQSLGVALHLCPILECVYEEGVRRQIPPLAFMVTVHGSFEAPQGGLAFNETIRVHVTLTTGESSTMGFRELWTQPQDIQDVAPLTPCLLYVLYIHQRLLAWDFRSVLPAGVHLSEVQQELGLLARGPEMAKAHRRAAFWNLSDEERKQVIRDAVTSDIMEPGQKRVPLKGLIRPGLHRLDTGDDPEPFRVFRYFDHLLGIGRKVATPESDLSPATRYIYGAAPAPPLTEDMEEFIQHVTAPLPPKQRLAMQHWLRAKHLGFGFKEYCKKQLLPYKTVHKAAMDGLKALRASGQDPENIF
jgi:hypothetical protein